MELSEVNKTGAMYVKLKPHKWCVALGGIPMGAALVEHKECFSSMNAQKSIAVTLSLHLAVWKGIAKFQSCY